ncbi:MAG TPA: selenoneine biosynthesis selenosugar synthase SenB [Gemmataceae bacterium]|nr:selenoneine biosynthesis selenosugar synthase SenB [Gemmataceae bacterium]
MTPAPSGSRKGNRVTAQRWARILRGLGRRVDVLEEYHGERCDLLVALHALHSFPSMERYRSAWPEAPLVLALTGTDLYDSIHTRAEARQALELATRLVVLQPLGVAALPEALRAKARVIYQSVPTPRRRASPRTDLFEVCVLGHLRPVKDPFRTALAARLLPAASRLRVLHVGAALREEMAEQAAVEAAINPRYRWLGEVPRWQALRVLARCRLLVLSSELEGGANVVSEALAASVPVLSSRIAGSVGLLGEDYPGYFPVGDTEALARLLGQAEADADFYKTLQAWCARLRPLVEPARERRSWKELLRELGRR